MPPEDVQAYEDAAFFSWTRLLVQRGDPPYFLVGAASIDPVSEIAFGSALFFDRDGDVTHRYFKNHLVPFGEYVPLADWIPLLQRVPAIGKGLNAGTEPVSIDVNSWKIAPSICFETTVPHYIRNQVNQLTLREEEPDILVNVTNDGWFYGTACLDFHLACNVFRAVEMRKPMLVCANTGFSASIDQHGRILERGPRRDTGILRTEVSTTPLFSPYRTIGDWIPIGFAFATIVCGLIGLIPRRSSSQQNGLNDVAGKLSDDPDGG